MLSVAPKAITGLSRARVFRTTATTHPRPLTSLTMGFAEIAAWKARRAAATGSTTPATSPPAPPTMLHSAIAGPPFPRHLLTPKEPSHPNERSASEILDVPSLHVLGKLHAGSRNGSPAPLPAPAPAPAAPASDKPIPSGNKTVPKSTLASGLNALRRLGNALSGRGKTRSGTSYSRASGATTAAMVGGVPRDGGVAADKDQAQPEKKREFQRELPMFLGGGLY